MWKTDLGSADGAEEDGMGILRSGEGFICEWILVDVN